MAYDLLKSYSPLHATKTYLKILYLAARESERGVDKALCLLIDRGEAITVESEVNFSVYDELLSEVVYE